MVHQAEDPTPLHLAAEAASAGCLRALLAAGASPAARDARGRTPLHACAFAAAHRGRGLGAWPGAPAGTGAHHARLSSPFPSSPRCREAAECIALLAAHGASIADETDGEGRTVLHDVAAAGGGSAELVAALVRVGADVNARSKVRERPACNAHGSLEFAGVCG